MRAALSTCAACEIFTCLTWLKNTLLGSNFNTWPWATWCISKTQRRGDVIHHCHTRKTTECTGRPKNLIIRIIKTIIIHNSSIIYNYFEWWKYLTSYIYIYIYSLFSFLYSFKVLASIRPIVLPWVAMFSFILRSVPYCGRKELSINHHKNITRKRSETYRKHIKTNIWDSLGLDSDSMRPKPGIHTFILENIVKTNRQQIIRQCPMTPIS